MWWVEFERRLSLAYQTYVNHEGREVHFDQMKLRALLEKVTCDWISQIKSSIKLRLSYRPMNYTFNQSLQYFKIKMNIKYTTGGVAIRRLQETGKGRYRGRHGGRDSIRYGGRGRGSGRFGRGRGRGYSPKLGSKVITLMNGKRIYYRASIKFSDDIYHQMTNNQRETIHVKRK